MRTHLLALLLITPIAHADEAIDCFSTAAAAQTVATERDAGTPEGEAAYEVVMTMAALDHRPMDTVVLDRMIEAVYDAPEVTKDEVYSRVLEQCIALTVPPSKLSQNQK